MSRFADPTATANIDLGACQCPGTPHEADTATVRWDLGASALARIGRAEIQGAVDMDPMAAYRQVVLETVTGWNLLTADGTPAAITPATVAELDVETLKTIAEQADGLIQNRGSLPNGSGAPSAASSRGSASRTRTQTRRRGT